MKDPWIIEKMLNQTLTVFNGADSELNNNSTNIYTVLKKTHG